MEFDALAVRSGGKSLQAVCVCLLWNTPTGAAPVPIPPEVPVRFACQNLPQCCIFFTIAFPLDQ